MDAQNSQNTDSTLTEKVVPENKVLPSNSSPYQNSTEFEDRKKKLQELKEEKIQPYAARFERSHSIIKIKDEFLKNEPRPLEAILTNPRIEVKLSGRLMLLRPHGKLTFGQLRDVTGQIQICFMQDFLGVEQYKLLKKIDLGDFIGVVGEMFVTKHGELTLLVKEYQLLSKTLRPLPEKWHGLSDQETKYRYRYLDLLSDPETFKRFQFRIKLIQTLRHYLDEHGFMEVETPVLTNIASGAAAKPFMTHHNALDIPMYLRIAPETYLKRCVVGGFEKVYEFARCFRNEGMDPSHLQEFTMLEYYVAYANYQDDMDFTEKMIKHLVKTLLGKMEIELVDREGNKQIINFDYSWPRYSFVDLIKKDSEIDVLEYYGDAKSLLKTVRDKGIKIEKADQMGYGNLCDALYKKVSRPKLIQPCFVMNHPVDTKPLARKNDQDPRIADSYQLLINTWEVINAYSELVDPLDQRERLINQSEAKAGGDEEAMPMDEDYLYAMEHGMPPMAGWGMGIDRLTALLTNQDNLKDTVLFPIMRPL